MSVNSHPIVYWNRQEKREETEQVYGDFFLKWAYCTRPGQALVDHFLSETLVSRLYGTYQSSRLSGHKVRPFIHQFKIPMNEYDEGPFPTFNDFFIRKFKPEARKFVANPREMPAFSEARYFAYERTLLDQTFPVKGAHLSSEALLGGDREYSSLFEGGPLLLARLCPTDYHRFHFPDSGKVLKSFTIHGKLHSVNPVALQYKSEIFATNERQVTILDTENFGKLAYIEVGALCVGKIVQTYSGHQFSRGEEKGYFLFGASTVILLGQPGLWKPDADLIEQTARKRETLIRLGERVAFRL